MKRSPVLLVALSIVLTLVVSGLVFTAVDSQATSTSKSICVNKKSKELKLRKECRASERFFASADVLKKGGKSAYDTWLELGNRGSKQDFINSLVGPRGSSSSSSSNSNNPFTGMTCLAAVQYAEQYFGLSRVVKTDWDFIERQTGCDLDTQQIVSNSSTSSELNDVLQSYELTVTGAPTLVQSVRGGSGYFEVPVTLDFEIELRGDWVVCDSSLPIYRDLDWSSNSSLFDDWDQLELAKTAEGQYSLDTFVYIYRGWLGTVSEDGDLRVSVCQPDSTNSKGWSTQGLFPLPLTSPGEFIGLDIPFISDWGWE